MATAIPMGRAFQVMPSTSAVAVGDFVAVGPDGLLVKALASDPDAMPCIGVCLSKPGASLASVTQIIPQPSSAPRLDKKVTYWISETVPGEVQDVPPTGPLAYVQAVAEGISTSKWLVRVDPSSYTQRAPLSES